MHQKDETVLYPKCSFLSSSTVTEPPHRVDLLTLLTDHLRSWQVVDVTSPRCCIGIGVFSPAAFFANPMPHPKKLGVIVDQHGLQIEKLFLEI